jgi:ABC-2 type transport system permease protein
MSTSASTIPSDMVPADTVHPRTVRSHTVRDSATMLRRSLRHMLRYPSMTLMLIGMPVVFLLLFVYVLGGTLGAGLGGPGGRGEYIQYVVPGILLMAVAGGAQGTAISVAMDMTEGIIARFRTMAISRAAVLTGHVVGSVIQTMLAMAAVIGVALLVGFRPTAGPVRWIATIGVLAMITVALTWLSVALGMVSDSVETASNLPMFLMLLPFLGSGFVPTDSMPAGVRWFAENQPFTPFIETLRGLLMGAPIGSSGLLTIVWCVAITAGGYLWSRSLYNSRSTR